VSASLDRTMRVWDILERVCVAVLDSDGDAAALAGGADRFPWLALRGRVETVIQSATTAQAVAWLPTRLYHPAPRCDGRTWAGAGGKDLCLFTLEGNPPGPG